MNPASRHPSKVRFGGSFMNRECCCGKGVWEILQQVQLSGSNNGLSTTACA